MAVNIPVPIQAPPDPVPELDPELDPVLASDMPESSMVIPPSSPPELLELLLLDELPPLLLEELLLLVSPPELLELELLAAPELLELELLLEPLGGVVVSDEHATVETPAQAIANRPSRMVFIKGFPHSNLLPVLRRRGPGCPEGDVGLIATDVRSNDLCSIQSGARRI